MRDSNYATNAESQAFFKEAEALIECPTTGPPATQPAADRQRALGKEESESQ